MSVGGITDALPDVHLGPVLVHSDLRGLLAHLGPDVRQAMRESGSGDGIMGLMMDRLRAAVGARHLWIPAYNYDFCETGTFSVPDDPAQIGAFPEYYRNNEAEWRTATPVFSVCGSGVPARAWSGCQVDPFGVESEFHQLCERDGLVLFFGVLFSPTMTHYVERVASNDGPLYRYDKLFHGQIRISTSESQMVTLKYHVIPRGVTIKYDMARLQAELIEAAAMCRLAPEYGETYVIAARDLVRIWSDGVAQDPYYLLTEESRQEASAIVAAHGGGRLQIANFNDTDFGSPENASNLGIQE